MRKILTFIYMLCFVGILPAPGQNKPGTWIFGRGAGINFLSDTTLPVRANVNAFYTPSSCMSDEAGRVLFYCEGKNIYYPDGSLMPGSANPVWAAPMHLSMDVKSLIVPFREDHDKYYVFMLTPSSGEPPFGAYYKGVLTYTVVDMRLNNGRGGVVSSQANILLNINLDRYMMVIPAEDCSHWLLVYKPDNASGAFLAYKVSDEGIAAPVYSPVSSTVSPYSFNNMKMVYAPEHAKILTSCWATYVSVFDFDKQSGMVNNGRKVISLSDFTNGSGVTDPSVSISANEKHIYVLGYPFRGSTGSIVLYQYPVDLNRLPAGLITDRNVIFQSSNSAFLASHISIPYASSDCDIRLAPDNRIYIAYHAGVPFLGRINNPDNEGIACDFDSIGLRLVPDAYCGYYLPQHNGSRAKADTITHSRDTTLCFVRPVVLKAQASDFRYYRFEWNTGAHEPELPVSQPGTYWLQSLGNCSWPVQVDTIRVFSSPEEQCRCTLQVPSAFTPNGDNRNDIFRPVIPFNCIQEAYRLYIYNRWGEPVFTTYDVQAAWDGTYKGKNAETGTYFYFITYKDRSGTTIIKKGDLTLLR